MGAAGLGIGIGDPGLNLAPERSIMDERRAQLHHPVEVGRVGQRLGGDVPEPLEGFIMKPQPPVGAEDRHRVVQLVQGRLLHLHQRVVLGAQLQLAGDVGEDDQQAAERVRLAHHPQGASVRQGPGLVRRRFKPLVECQLASLEPGVVGGLR